MNVAIIGAGLIGKKRALALPPGINLKTVCDKDERKGKKLASKMGCNFEKNWQKVLIDKEIDAVFVCTTNDYLSKITIATIRNGKHALVEKPGARNLKELEMVYEIFKKNPVVLSYGYNHRFHPAILKAKKLIDSKKFGHILFIRARYGHGGRLGYEKEWRFKKSISGGGELLDQGSHLIDLVNFFCRSLNKVNGFVTTLFWKTKLEDAAFFQLRNNENQLAHLSVTCLEWKNIFSCEIMLEKAKIQIDGLGGSYGKEKLTLYKMKPKMGPPTVAEFLFSEIDHSWENENLIFFERIRKKIYTDTFIKDALYVLRIVEKLYKENAK